MRTEEELEKFLGFKFGNLTANYNFFPVQSLNTLYLILPKCANLSIKHLLYANAKQDFDSPFREIKAEINTYNNTHSSNIDALKQLLTGDCFKFTFVRNPYERLLSCWKNKIRWPTTFDIKNEIYQSHLERLNSGMGDYRFETLDVSFAQFVETLASLETAQMDRHWAPMYDLSRPDLITYDFVGKVENYRSDMGHLCELHNWVPHREEHLNRSYIETPAEFSDAYIRALIYKRYQEDFEFFGYEK